MKCDKKCSIRVRVSESMKIRTQAYMLKNDCSEAEVVRRALKKFLQTSVSSARAFVYNRKDMATNA